MPDSLKAATDALIDALDAIEDPVARYQASREVEASLDTGLRGVRQRIARDLKQGGRTWREVGEIMGGVSPQRAEQISRGV